MPGEMFRPVWRDLLHTPQLAIDVAQRNEDLVALEPQTMCGDVLFCQVGVFCEFLGRIPASAAFALNAPGLTLQLRGPFLLFGGNRSAMLLEFRRRVLLPVLVVPVLPPLAVAPVLKPAGRNGAVEVEHVSASHVTAPIRRATVQSTIGNDDVVGQIEPALAGGVDKRRDHIVRACILGRSIYCHCVVLSTAVRTAR